MDVSFKGMGDRKRVLRRSPFQNGAPQPRTPRKAAGHRGVVPFRMAGSFRGKSESLRGVNRRHSQRGATAHVQHLPGHETVVGRQEKQRRVRHVVGRAHAAYGDAVQDALRLRRAVGVALAEEFGGNRAGPMALTVMPSRPSSMASVRSCRSSGLGGGNRRCARPCPARRATTC